MYLGMLFIYPLIIFEWILFWKTKLININVKYTIFVINFIFWTMLILMSISQPTSQTLLTNFKSLIRSDTGIFFIWIALPQLIFGTVISIIFIFIDRAINKPNHT